MADKIDQNENDDSPELELSDDEAKQLLDENSDETSDSEGELKANPPTGESATDTTDWKAEAEKWKKLSRRNEAAAKSNADKLKQFEDQGKSESERLQEDRDTHKSRAEKAEAALRRREIAENRAPEHATTAQIKAVAKRLAGDSDDDLEQDADELFALLAPAPVVPKTPSRPKERLKGGSEPDEPVEETDPRRLAAAVPRGQHH